MRARIRAVQPGLALRGRARDRDRAGAARAGIVVVGGVALALSAIAARRARQPVLPQHVRPAAGPAILRRSRAGSASRSATGTGSGSRSRSPTRCCSRSCPRTLAGRERPGRIPAADPRCRHVPHLVARRVRRGRRRRDRLRRAHAEPLAGRRRRSSSRARRARSRSRRSCTRRPSSTASVDTPLGVQQGHRAALLIGVTCVVTALVWLGLARAREPRAHAAAASSGQATVVAVVVLAVGAIAAAHPVAKFDDFKSTRPGRRALDGHDTTTCSAAPAAAAGSSGAPPSRSSARIRSTAAAPAPGSPGGCSTARCPLFSQFAHSLYLEALGELGIVGLLLISAAVLLAGVGAIRSALTLQSGEIAAAAACGIAFFVAAAYDWVWQLSGIAVVGVGMLGVALGTLPRARDRAWGALRRALGRPSRSSPWPPSSRSTSSSPRAAI